MSTLTIKCSSCNNQITFETDGLLNDKIKELELAHTFRVLYASLAIARKLHTDIFTWFNANGCKNRFFWTYIAKQGNVCPTCHKRLVLASKAKRLINLKARVKRMENLCKNLIQDINNEEKSNLNGGK